MNAVKVARVLAPRNGKVWGIYCSDGSYCEVDHLQLINPKLVVDTALRMRDLELNGKGLHAWVEGYMVRSDYPFPMPGDGWQQLRYTVAKGYFHTYPTDDPNDMQVFSVNDTSFNYAVFNEHGRVWAY
jgi:hypothetical protein